jgi:beta-glucosidase
MLFKKSTLSSFLFICLSCSLTAQAYKNRKLTVEARVKDLLQRLTVEEKVAQMRIFHANLGIEAKDDNEVVLPNIIKEKLKIGIAGIKNPFEHESPATAARLNNKLQKYIIENNRFGIPALFVCEAYNGVDAKGSTYFARPMNQAATFNPELIKNVWDVIGREARSRGFHMCHSPEADLARDPRFGRMSEAFGEDTHLVTEMVRNAVKGVQGDFKGLSSTHIGAVTKHFAAYGQVQGGKNFASVEISPRVLIDEVYPPFEAAVKDAKTLGIMASHGDINGIASHANPELLTEVLRNKWGFKGYVVSDANDIGRLNFFMKVAETMDEAATMAVKAGMDVDLYNEDAYASLPRLVKNDPSLMKYIDRGAAAVLRTKFILGLFDNPYSDESLALETKNNKALEICRKLDENAVVLLKNNMIDNSQLLPLNIQGKYKNYGLIGPVLRPGYADAFQKILGSNGTVFSEKGFDLTDRNTAVPKLNMDTEKGFNAMLEIAKKSDIVIMFLGGDEFTAKEGFFNNALGDRASVDPVGRQDELLLKVKELGKPIIVILQHRRTLSINEISKNADAILDTWDLGETGSEVIANMVFGNIIPSGKLPVTIPRTIGQMPIHYSQKEINFKKGYLFMENGPLYPFGFGLSYTKFDYNKLVLSDTIFNNKNKITASIELANIGKFDGSEVVQMYIKDRVGSVIRPIKELKSFQRVLLKTGEKKIVTFDINPEMLMMTGIDMKSKIEAGDFDVMIGSNSADLKTLKFKVLPSAKMNMVVKTK